MAGLDSGCWGARRGDLMIVRAMTVAALLLAGGLCPAGAENCDDRVAGSCKPAPILVPTVTADDVATQAAEGRAAEPT